MNLDVMQMKVAWLRPPKYFRSIFSVLRQGLRYVVGFPRPNFVHPISEHREWLRTMTLKSALVDGTSSRTVFGLFTACAQRDSRPKVSDWLWQIQSGTGQIQ